MANTPLTVRVPIKGQLLVKLDGFDDLHEVGAFTQDVAVAFQPGPGEIAFSFNEKFWRETIQGVGGPTPEEAVDESTVAVIEDILQAERIMGPEPRYLAVLLYSRLLREGKLK